MVHKKDGRNYYIYISIIILVFIEETFKNKLYILSAVGVLALIVNIVVIILKIKKANKARKKFEVNDSEDPYDEMKKNKKNFKLFEIIQEEKAHMNKIRFTVNYIVVPIYVLLMIVCLTLVGILMSIDETKYTPTAITLFGFLGLATVLLLVSVPFTRKKELEIELLRYDFDDSEIEDKSIYIYSDDEVNIEFDKNGMYLGDKFYWYNHMKISLLTSNELLRVWITLEFSTSDDSWVKIPLSNKSLYMLKRFNIKITNQEVLDLIVNQKKLAFEQIYKTGSVKASTNHE